MKKLLWTTMMVSSVLALAVANDVCAANYTETAQVQSLAVNKVYIYADLSNQEETMAIMQSLETGGLVGQFIVSPQDVAAYPDFVSTIASRGHLLIIKAVQSQPVAVPAPGRVRPAKQRVARENQKAVAAPQREHARVETPVYAPRVETPVPAPRVEAPAPAPRVEAPAPAPRVEAPAPAPRVEAPAPAPRVETPPPAPRVEAPAPAPRVEAPTPALRVEAPTPAPRVEAPTPAPRVETPSPAPSQEQKGSGWVRPRGNYTDRQMQERFIEERPNLSKKERLERYFLGPLPDGERKNVRNPQPAKPVDDVPDWSLLSIGKLSKAGLLSPDEANKILSEPNREMMAKLIARAYHNLGISTTLSDDTKYDCDFELQKLIREYDTELRNLGYGAGQYTAYKELPRENGLKIGGELRYNYVNHSGPRSVSRSYTDTPTSYDRFDSRVRARLYADKPLDGNWTVHAMAESEKSWFDDSYDGKPDVKRIYIDGEHKDIKWTAGRFGEMYGDGNIYDGEFTGVKAATGKKVRVAAALGKLRDQEKGVAVTANYSKPKYDLSAGIYRFSDIKSYNSSYRGQDLLLASLGGMWYYGNFGLGAMLLGSDHSDINNDRYGYVLSARYGRNRSWVPGSFEFFAHYYNQPDTTYFGHTMVGLADNMEGFKGYNVGLYYTLAENVVYSFEYYDLYNKYNNANARTIWNHVSYYF